MTTPHTTKHDELASRIIAAATEIHQQVGPGLFESAYRTCLIHDLAEAGLPFETRRALPFAYKGITSDLGYHADLVVDGCVLVEVKAVEVISPIHVQEVYTFVRLGNYPVGLLLNFGAAAMKAGLKRIVNGYPNQQGEVAKVGGFSRTR